MYCGFNEAYNDNITNNNAVAGNNMDQLGGFDNYSDIDIHNHFSNNFKQFNTMIPAYFTAQGDISNKNSNGTSINDLKHNQQTSKKQSSGFDSNTNSDSILSDSDFSIDSEMTIPSSINDSISKQMKKQRGSKSNYYDRDNVSLSSLKTISEDDSTTCGKCDSMEKISNGCKCGKSQGVEPSGLENNKNHMETIREYFDTANLGYSIKELLIIILAGIILIFILDLLVRIGKKMNK